MDSNPIHLRSRLRVLPWIAALSTLFFAGTGAVLADENRGHHDRRPAYAAGEGHVEGYVAFAHHRHRSNHRYDRHRGCRDHRYDRHHDRRDRRYDRHDRYDRRRYDHYRQGDRHRYYGDQHQRRSFDVPRKIAHDRRHDYRSYHHGRVYHDAHRHHHEVYRFPVYTEWGVEYYPHAYCKGSFFGRGVFRDGRAFFDVRIGF